jgi:hypothetical protein
MELMIVSGPLLEYIYIAKSIAERLCDEARVALDPMPEYAGDLTIKYEYANCFEDLIRPRYSRLDPSKWFKLDKAVTPFIFKLTGIQKIICWYQDRMYVKIYRDALQENYSMRDFILKGASRVDLLHKAGLCSPRGLC